MLETGLLLAIAAVFGGALVFFTSARPHQIRGNDLAQRVGQLESERVTAAAEREKLVREHASTSAASSRIPELEHTIATLRDDIHVQTHAAAEARASLQSERQAHAARIEELERMGTAIEQKFVALASDALGKNSTAFLTLVNERFETNKVSADKDFEDRRREIEALVKPIGDSLTKFEAKVGEIEKARIGAYEGISEQVKNLVEGQTGLRTETTRLVQALRQPKTRGRWGEYQLRNVLEMAGMVEHVDFVEEETVEGENGRLRPDVIVRLPGGKSIVVDAKTPLDAYLSAVEATDEIVRAQCIANHARQVQAHVRALSGKDYWKALPETPDFVVMFVPGEAFFAAAIESDPGLFEQAVRQRVLISTPTTFIALIKAIAYGWQQDKLAVNAQLVGETGRDLYERIKTFGCHMDELGKSLRQAVERYNKSVGSLEGRVLPAARKFENLAIAPAGSSIDALAPLEVEPRSLQAVELLIPKDEEQAAGS